MPCLIYYYRTLVRGKEGRKKEKKNKILGGFDLLLVAIYYAHCDCSVVCGSIHGSISSSSSSSAASVVF